MLKNYFHKQYIWADTNNINDSTSKFELIEKKEMKTTITSKSYDNTNIYRQHRISQRYGQNDEQHSHFQPS